MTYLLLWILFLCGISAPFWNGLVFLYNMHYLKTGSIPHSVLHTVKTVLVIGYMIAYQKLQHNVVLVDKETYDVLYVLHEQLYKIRIHARRGPQRQRVLQIINDQDEDVTADVQPYLGPMENFHGIRYNPSMIGFPQLTFNLHDGTSKTFLQDDPICLD